MIKNKKGVFGLTSVQSFFAIILGLALLAYVIVVVMGTLNSSTILQSASATVTNETGGWLNSSGYTLAQAGTDGFSSPSIVSIYNRTSGDLLPSTNYTLVGNILYNATVSSYNNISITYTYSYDTTSQNNAQSILGNTSTGITGFFSAINPVYAILAVLVIILVLVVLVRVVQAPKQSGSAQL